MQCCNFPRNGCSSKFTPRSDYEKLQQTTSKTLQESISLFIGKVNNRKIWKRLNKYGLSGKVATGKLLLLSKEIVETQLRFAKSLLNRLQGLWNNVLWNNRPKRHKQAHKHKNIFAHKPQTSCQAQCLRGWWFWVVLQPQNLDSLTSLSQSWIIYQSILEPNLSNG